MSATSALKALSLVTLFFVAVGFYFDSQGLISDTEVRDKISDLLIVLLPALAFLSIIAYKQHKKKNGAATRGETAHDAD